MKHYSSLTSLLLAFVLSLIQEALATDRLYDVAEGSSSGRSRINKARSSFRIGKVRRGCRDTDEPLEMRAERFFDRGGVPDASVKSDRTWSHENFFQRAYHESIEECMPSFPDGIPPEVLKESFMDKVEGYRYRQVLLNGVQQYRSQGLSMTVEEYEAARREFLNQKEPPQGSKREMSRVASLKSQYRKELRDPGNDRDRTLRKMAKHRWTEEDIKPYTMPPIGEVREFIEQLRAGQAIPSTEHVSIALHRSNREEQFDLNQEQLDPHGVNLELNLGNLHIDHDDAQYYYDNQEAEEEDSMPYDLAYHNPLSYSSGYSDNVYNYLDEYE